MDKFKDILEKIETMSVMDLNELVKAIEEKFGVSAIAIAGAGHEEESLELIERDINKIDITYSITV